MFFYLLGILFNKAVCSIDYGLGRAVILLELEDAQVVVIFVQVQDVCHVGSAE